MSQSNCPGGLMALAIINMIVASMMLLSSLLGLLAQILLSQVTANYEEVAVESDVDAYVLDGGVLTDLILFMTIGVLLLLSGIGYLQLKKSLGYVVGNIAALIWIVTNIAKVTFIGSEFGIHSILGFIYPVVTLFMLNIVFKHDFAK